jgi:hypothetical protein
MDRTFYILSIIKFSALAALDFIGAFRLWFYAQVRIKRWSLLERCLNKGSVQELGRFIDFALGIEMLDLMDELRH